MRQQLFHNVIVVDLPGEFSPLFRALELLVRFDLQRINEKILYGVGSVVGRTARLLLLLELN